MQLQLRITRNNLYDVIDDKFYSSMKFQTTDGIRFKLKALLKAIHLLFSYIKYSGNFVYLKVL